MGVGVAIVGFATIVTLWATPSIATGQQAVQSQTQTKTQTQTQTQTQTAPQTDKKPGQTIEKEVVEKPASSGRPSTMTVRRQAGAPALASVFGGGPRLGIEIHDVSTEDVAALKLAGQQGAVVAVVEKDSAAEKAGLKANDVIVAYDGETVRSAQQFTRLVRETASGRAVKIALMRDGKRMELEATPAEQGDESVSVYLNRDLIRGDIEKQMEEQRQRLNELRLERRLPAPGAPELRFRLERPPGSENFQWFGGDGAPFEMLGTPGRGRLGVTVQAITPELATYFGVKDGVLVASVAADSPAAKAGIRAGDVITTVDGKPVTSAGEIAVLLAAKTGQVPIGLTRDRKPLTLTATIESPKPVARRSLRGTPA
jgi:serine protease Do